MKPAFDAAANLPNPAARTIDEEEEYRRIKHDLVVGFFLGGNISPERTPAAFQIVCDPLGGKPIPKALTLPSWNFNGAPNMIQRLIYGCDGNLRGAILSSGKWTGSDTELDDVLRQHVLAHPTTLPIRDAIDFVYSCISSTIKAFKFSNLSQVCGGPIEIAVITADRRFRWVRHKPWDSAITEGDPLWQGSARSANLPSRILTHSGS